MNCESKHPVKWTYNEGSLPDNAIYEKTSLYIVNFGINNEGEYICEGLTTEKYEWTSQTVPFFAKSILKLLSMSIKLFNKKIKCYINIQIVL